MKPIRYNIEKVKQYSPFSNDRVDDPWQDFPDYEKFNDMAYSLLKLDIEQMIHDPYRQSHGCLILGEAGTGKTHLLMRAVKNLSKSNHIMFIRRVNNIDTVSQHIWSGIIQSLVKPIPDPNFNGESQLDEFLTHVFSGILKNEIIKKVNEGVKSYKELFDAIQNDPYNIPNLIKNENFRYTVRNIIVNKLQDDQPEIDISFVDAFFKYYYLKDPNRRREIRSWLEGQMNDPEKNKIIGLPSWIPMDETPNYLSIKEEKAENGIHTLSLLANYYPNPLILCLDQLEGLRGRKELVGRFTDVIREIFTRCNNFLIVTCIFPNLWEEFQEYVEVSYTDRAGQSKIVLDKLNLESARHIIALRLSEYHKIFQIFDEIYPFEDEDIPILLFDERKGTKKINSIRHVLSLCNNAWNQWLFGRIPIELDHTIGKIEEADGCDLESTTIDEEYKNTNISLKNKKTFRLKQDVTLDEINSFLENTFQEHEKSLLSEILQGIANEEILFNIIIEIIDYLSTINQIDRGKHRKIQTRLVMPIHKIIDDSENNERTFIGILNATGNSYTARMKNLLNYYSGGYFSESILIRDERAGDFPSRGKGGEYLYNFRKIGKSLLLSAEEIYQIESIYSVIEEIKNQDLEIRNYTLNLEDLYNWLISTNYFMKNRLFQTISKLNLGKNLFSQHNTGKKEK